ncbi:Coiled-coil domain-containing protein 84 [Bagarius yarrelli]|uniref:Coiled-coil domain-containing protein 84 n=1 Tax=Bagarius yarrelli TaxID=175774 RepID=A0A556UY33_BAGYA|nr:Coiled-coil domain-containing protein 84 [Bagarius yarrelli]
MGAFYCALCRQTDFSGKGHIYGKSHQSKLKVVLVKFLEKVKEARRTLKCPKVEKFDASEHEIKFWCYCCETEVQRHVTNGRVAVLYAGLLEHMSTQEHRKNTHAFWWKNKADQKHKEKFIITEQETNRTGSQQTELFHSALTEQPGPSRIHPFTQSLWDESGAGLTFIGHQQASVSGNIHTGAVPPWLLEDPEDDSTCKSQDIIGPSVQDFLKHKEQQKLKKLPANRVGANFDHSSQTSADWLPSFGRVWNSGRRWHSRHQFRQEQTQNRQKRRREHEHGGKAAKKQKHLSNGDV